MTARENESPDSQLQQQDLLPPQLDADASTEERLLRAAEMLFAVHGIEGASLRAVMQAAQTNVAAVHYHFGSKDGLLDAVVRSRMDAVLFGQDRLVSLMGRAASATEIAAALIQPVLDLVDAGGADWLAIVAELIRTNHPALSHVFDGFAQRNLQFVELIRSLDPGASTHDIAFRLVQAMSATLLTLGNMTSVLHVLSREGLTWSESEVRDQLIATVAAILRGPGEERG